MIPLLAAMPGLPALPCSLAAQAASTVSVAFGNLPSAWRSQENLMDDVWRPLGRGVNYYAFGAPMSANADAARSDPASPSYRSSGLREVDDKTEPVKRTFPGMPSRSPWAGLRTDTHDSGQ